MTRLSALAAAALVAMTGTAFAHSNDDRLAEQAAWIEAGRQDGSITWTEGLKLRKEQREIARVKAEFEADGRLSPTERRVLHKMQDEAQANIQAETMDNVHRLSWLPRIGR